jgi:hypothetical protein
MSIDDNTSDNTPVIKSRTGKFLQGMFDKKTAAPPTSRSRQTTSDGTPSEFIQVVPEPTMWDESEESNWDDDFVEAPQPAFIAPQTYPKPAVEFTPAPPPPPSTINSAVPKVTEEIAEDLPPVSPPAETIPPVPSRPIAPRPATHGSEVTSDQAFTQVAPKAIEEKSAGESARPLEVSIPRPKNIKYKTKDPNAAPTPPENKAEAIAKGANAAIDMDIQRPKNIKYKTKAPVKASLPDRLLAPIKSLVTKISSPFDRVASVLPNRPPKIYIEQVSANETPPTKKSWQLPSLGRENFRQILVIAGALFLAMTVAWAVINFWPRSTSAVVTAPAPVIQPAPVKPIISPEAALVEAVKNRSQSLASLYPAGLIANLELDADRKLATVIVGNLWFSLTPEQQQQTAQSLWQQARNYQMSGLEVRATTDRLLARSPFVGTEAVLTSF